MNVFVCHCKFKFIISKRKVFGPIFTEEKQHDAQYAKLMPMDEFIDGYADCWNSWNAHNAILKK